MRRKQRVMLVLMLCGVVGRFAMAASPQHQTPTNAYDPYYVHRDYPKLTTPQWIGEESVEAVVVLAIDDMRDTAKYEAYLRPILERLKEIDGRAPVSIMTCKADPADPQLQMWLKEGLSIECHTIDHPCPLLQGGDFAKAAGRLHPKFRTPVVALWVQAALAVVLIATNSFEGLLDYASAAMLITGSLTVLSVMILRKKLPNEPRPYRLGLYPIAPLAYAGSSLFVLAILAYNGDFSVWIAFAWFALAMLVYRLMRLR
mgnify:CR=1 FL=1